MLSWWKVRKALTDWLTASLGTGQWQLGKDWDLTGLTAARCGMEILVRVEFPQGSSSASRNTTNQGLLAILKKGTSIWLGW